MLFTNQTQTAMNEHIELYAIFELDFWLPSI